MAPGPKLKELPREPLALLPPWGEGREGIAGILYWFDGGGVEVIIGPDIVLLWVEGRQMKGPKRGHLLVVAVRESDVDDADAILWRLFG